MGRYEFKNLEELLDDSIPCIIPGNSIYYRPKAIHSIKFSNKEINGFLDPRVDSVKNEYGIFGLWTSKRTGLFLKDKYRKYYSTRNDPGGYYRLYHNYEKGVDNTPLNTQSAYSEINGTEILLVRFINGDRKYKFTITYNEGEEYICVACKFDISEFTVSPYDGAYRIDAAADSIFMAHLLSIITLLLRPNECDLSIFKDNLLFNFNMFENGSDNILDYILYTCPTEVSSFIIGQENDLQLSYYFQNDSFMFIVTFTDGNTVPCIDPYDIFTDISTKINVGGTAIKQIAIEEK